MPVSSKEQVGHPLFLDSTSSRPPTQATSNKEQKPPGFVNPYPDLPLPSKQSTGPHLNREHLGPSFISSVDLQSPTFKLDLEEAIKLASSSATVSEESHPPKVTPQTNMPTFTSSSYNDLYEAFPNLVANLLPDIAPHPPFQGTSTANSGNSMGLNSFVPPPINETGPTTVDTLGYFPALLGSGTSDSSFNLNSSDPFMNSGSFTELQFGQHGEIGDKLSVSNWDPPISPDKNEPVAQDWNKVPLHSPQQSGSNIQQRGPATSSNQNLPSDQSTIPLNSSGQSRSESSKQPKKSPPYGVATGKVAVSKNQQKRAVKTASKPNPKTASTNTSDSLELPRMPNSEPFVLEKASEVDPQEGFIEVKSRRKRRAVVNSSKPKDPSSPKTPSKAKLSKQPKSPSLKNTVSSHRETVPQPSTDVSAVKNRQSSTKSKVVDGRESTEPPNQSKPTQPPNSLKDQAVSNGSDSSHNGSQLGCNKVEKSSNNHRLGLTVSSNSDPDSASDHSQHSTKESSSGGNENGSQDVHITDRLSLSNSSHARQTVVNKQQNVALPSNKSTQIAITGNGTCASSALSSSKAQPFSYACLVCYEGFSASDDFERHCQSGSHCCAVVIAIGGDKLPKYAPPHPMENHMKLCKK